MATEAEPEAFQRAQDAWSERLITEEKFCDGVAVLGAGGQRHRFIRALLANLSDPLSAALFGSFQEASSKELVLKDVTPEAFRVLLRAAVHLDPELSAESAVHALKAAKMYLVEGLEKHCLSYLRSSIQPEQVLEVMTAAAKLDYVLPADVQKQYWSMILVNSAKVLDAASFVSAHGSLIARIIQMDEFAVTEERLWTRLLEWSSKAVQEPELLGPFLDALPSPSEKRQKGETSTDSERERQCQVAVLQAMTKHIRFSAMSKEFFADNVRLYLKREDSEAVMMYFLLGRPPPSQLTSRRAGLSPPEQVFPVEVTCPSMPEGAEQLAVGRGSWKLPHNQTAAGRLLIVRLLQPIQVTKISLCFSGEGVVWGWKIRATLGARDGAVGPEFANSIRGPGRVRTMELATGLKDQLTILPISERDRVSATNTYSSSLAFSEHAALVKVEVFGKKCKEEHAADVVHRFFQDLSAPEPDEVSQESRS